MSIDQHLLEVVSQVVDERDRQLDKWGEQNHPDGTGRRVPVVHQIEAMNAAWWAKARTDLHAGTGTLTYLDILLEEVFEAAECEAGSDDLRKELIQVSAVALSWVEKIDRDRAKAAKRAGTPAAIPPTLPCTCSPDLDPAEYAVGCPRHEALIARQMSSRRPRR